MAEERRDVVQWPTDCFARAALLQPSYTENITSRVWVLTVKILKKLSGKNFAIKNYRHDLRIKHSNYSEDLKSRLVWILNGPVFKWLGLTITIAKARPFENPTIWNSTLKKSGFQMFPDFRSLLYSNYILFLASDIQVMQTKITKPSKLA